MHDQAHTSEQGTPAPAQRSQQAVARGLTAVRATVVLPVVVLALAALGAFAYATYTFGDSARRIVDHPSPPRANIGLFLVVIDLFLIGTTLLIAAIGLYELFLTRADDESASHLPAWLQIADLNDLKARVISMIVLVAAVTFVEVLVDPGPGAKILDLGIAIAVVVGALTAFVRFGDTRRGES